MPGRKHLALAVFSAFASAAHADLLITETLDASILANEVMDTVDGNLTIDSQSLTGFAGQVGTFTNGLSVPGFLDFEDGIIMSSGSVSDIAGPNSDDGTSTSLPNGIENDPDFDLLTDSPNGTDDAIFIEIEFIPNGDTLTGTFVFASEEYNEYAPPDGALSGGQFYDVMGFFVNGINYSLTADGDDVSINSVNKTLNAADFVDNDFGDFDPAPTPFNIAPDGFTRRLSWTAPVNPGVINTLKFGVADGGDSQFDSWLLIDRDSFKVLNSAVDVDLAVSTSGTGGEIAAGTPMVISTNVENIGSNATGREITVVHTLPAGVTVNGGIAASIAESGVNGTEWVCLSTAAVPQTVECRSTTSIGNTSGNSTSVFNFSTDPIDVALVGNSLINSVDVLTTDNDTGTGNNSFSSSTLVIATDSTSPVVTIDDVPAITGGAAPYSVTLMFDEVVTGLDLADVVVGNGVASNLVILSPIEATVVITPDATGDVTIDVPSGAVQDASGNDSAASATAVTIFDPTSPVLSIDNAPGVIANTNPFDVNFSFSVPVTGFALNDISVSNGVPSNFTMIDASTWSATITPDTTNDVVISVPAAAAQSTSSGVDSSNDSVTVTVNASAPTGILSGAPSITNSLASYPMTLTWSEDVTDMQASDITITNGVVSSFSPDTPLIAGSVYTFDVTPAGDGEVIVSVPESSVLDIANNGNSLVSVTTIVDTIPPVLTIAAVAGDDYINANEDDAPVIVSGTSIGLQDGASVNVNVGGIPYVSIVSSDTWSISIPAASVQLFNANEIITADAVDSAGNPASQATRTINYDVIAPSQPSVNTSLISSALPVLTGSANTDPGDTLTVLVNGILYTAGDGNLVDDLAGAWTLTIPSGNDLPDGNYSIVVTVIDSAGNSSVDVSSNELTIDTTPPATPSVAVDLLAANDSGTLDDDNITNVATATFSVPASSATPGSLVTLYSDLVAIGTTTASADGSFSLSASTLVEGTENISWTSTDTAGNESANSPSLSVTLDTSAPAPTINAPHTADNIVNAAEANPFSVSGTSEADSVVSISISDGSNPAVTASVSTDGAGNWSVSGLDLSGLVDGSLAINATATDVAGNSGASSESNTSLVSTAPVLVLNAISGDDALNATEATQDLVISGTSTGLADGDNVTITIGTNSYLASVAGGLWQVTVPAIDTGSFVDGEVVTADAIDIAGNTASTISVALAVDTVLPVVAIDPAVLGTSSNEASYQVSGTCTVGDGLVSVSIAGGTPLTQDVSCASGGSWTATFDISAIADGLDVITVDATQGDAVGNTGTAATVTANKDTSMPSISVSVVAVDDVINIDEAAVDLAINGITVDIEDGQLVTVSVDGADYTTTVVSNSWSVVVPVSAVSAFETDEDVTANVSTLAGLAAPEAMRSIDIDIIAPSQPTVATLVSNDTTPTLTGTAVVEAGGTLTVTVNGVDYPAGLGALVVSGTDWTLDIPSSNSLVDGTYNVLVSLTDAAGNETIEPGLSALTIDTTAPAAPPVAVDLIAADDSGVSSSDDITNETTPTFVVADGTLNPGESVTVFADAVDVGTTVVNPAGGFTLVSAALLDGNYSISYTLADALGNVSSSSPALPIVIDTVANAPSIDADIAGDNIINASEMNSVLVSGITENDATVSIVFTDTASNTESVVTTAEASGIYTLNATPADVSALTPGGLQVSVSISDIAGNVSTPTSVSVQFDPDPPAPATVDTLLSNSGTPTVTGNVTLDAGDSIVVTINSQDYSEGPDLVISGATWTLIVPAGDSLDENIYDVLVEVTDVAGNVSSDTSTDELTIDLTAPANPSIALDLLASSDTGDSDTDNLTGLSSIDVSVPAGTVAPGDTATIHIDGVPVDTVTVAPDGGFLASLTGLVDGPNTISYTLVDAAGNVSASSPELVVLVDGAITAPTLTLPVAIDNQINGTEAVMVDLVGTAEPDSVVTVTIDDGGASPLVLTVNADSSGDWVLTNVDVTSLAEGTLDIVVSAEDGAGNSASATPANIELDISAPVLTVNTVAGDDVINIAESLLDQTISGTSQDLVDGATVIVEVNGQSYTGTVNSNSWSVVVPTVDVQAFDSTENVTVNASDSAGNAAIPVSVIVTTVLTAPSLTIDAIAGDDVISIAESLLDQTISGTSAGLDDGQIVTVNVNGIDYTSPVSANNWSVLVPSTDIQAFGPVETVTSTADDTAGNPATPATVDVVTDTTAPTLAFDAITGDDRINAAEAASDITVSGTSLGLLDGETVLVSLNGVDYIATVNSDIWSLTVPASDVAALTDGDQVTANASDAAGNDALPVSQTLIIDTVVPVVSINQPALATAANSSNYQVSGTCTIDDGSLDISIAGATPATKNVACASDGTWTASFDVGGVADGLDTVVVDASQIDAVGNVGVASTVTASKDTSSPSISIAAVASDDVINLSESVTQLVVTGTTSNISNGQQVTVGVAGFSFTSTVNNNQWLVLVPVSAVQAFGASETITADVSTVAGLAADTAERDISVDLLPPPLPTVATLVTSLDRPTISGTATLSASDTLMVVINLEPYFVGDSNLSVDGLGGWSLTIPVGNELSDGVYDVQVTATDSAGNASSIAGTGALTVDTTAPAAPVAPLDLATLSDSGASDTDDITNESAPLLELVSSSAAPGTIVRIFADATEIATTTLDASGGFSVNSSVLSDGVHSISYRFEDALGNMSASSPALAVTIDTVASVPVITTPIMSDGLISLAEESSVLIEGTTEADAEVEIQISDTSAGTVSTTVTSTSGGSWSNSASLLDVSTLIDGSLQVVATVTDLAGNTATSVAESVIYDPIAPTEPTVVAQTTNSTTPTLSGTLTLNPGDTFTVTVAGTEYSEGTNLTQDGVNWTLVIPAGAPLPEGDYEVVVTVMDAAGNSVSDTMINELIVDLTAPPDPSTALDLIASSDTGTSDTDNLTNLTTIDVALPAGSVEADATVDVFVDGVLAASTTASADGSVSVTLSGLADGVPSLTYSQSDEAGNVSAQSPSLDVTIDTAITSPTIDTPIALDNSINASEAGVVTLTGSAEANSEVTITVEDIVVGQVILVATTNASGQWQLSGVDVSALVDGSLSFSATSVDTAGNSADSASVAAIKDTEAPTLSIAAIAGDDVINAAESLVDQAVSGTSTGLADGDTVAVNINGIDYSAPVAGGNWSVVIPAVDIQAFDPIETVSANATDAAGNNAVAVTSTLSSNINAPILTLEAIAGDDRINATEAVADLVISGTSTGLIDGESVLISLNGLDYIATVASDIWSVVVPASDVAALTDGDQVTANASDAAGNDALPVSQTLIIDTVVPVVSINQPALATAANSSNYQVSGTCTIDDGSLDISIAGATPATKNVACASDGTWTASFDVGGVADGLDTVVVDASQIDAVGNVGVASTVTASKDTSSPSISIAAVASDDVINLSESVTQLVVTGTTSNISNGQQVTVGVAGFSFTSTVNNNQWLVLVPVSAVQAFGASETITADVSTVAGLAADTAERDISVDLLPPPLPTVATLVTSLDRPTISGTATLSASDTLMVVINLEPYFVGDSNLSVDGLGGWSLTIPVGNELSDGVYDVQVTATDSAGNASSIAGTGALTVDTTAPAAPVAPLDLATLSDSGASDTDDITNESAPLLELVSSSAAPGTIVRIFADATEIATTTLDASGGFSVNSSVLSDGVHSISYRFEDALGNMSASSPALAVTIDTVASVPVITTPIMSDGLISLAEESSVLIEGTTEADAEVEIQISDTSAGTVSTTVTSTSGGSWSNSASLLDVSTLIDGSLQVVATVTDLAGNTATSVAESVIYDPIAPTEPTVVAQTTNSTTPTLSGTLTLNPGDTFTVTVAGTEYSEGTNLTQDGVNWTLVIPAGAPLPEGDYEVVVTVMDAAGNSVSDTMINELIVDLTAPPDPSTALDLIASSDTGTSDTDNLTNLTTIDVALPAGSVEADATVDVFVDGVLAASTTASADGSVSVTLSGLADGVPSLTYSQSDEAGNVSAQSPSLDVTIDTAITSPTIDTPIAANDIANSNEAGALTLTGTAEPNSIVTITISDIAATVLTFVATADTNGDWEIAGVDLTSLLDGELSIDTEADDDSGNTASSATVSVDLDTEPPTVTLASVSDDNVINAAESLLDQTISGTSTGLLDGTTVTINVNDVDYSASVLAGAWSVLLPSVEVQAFDPVETITVTAVDEAGNSATPATADILSDTTVPVLVFDVIAGDNRLNATEVQTDVLISGTSTSLNDGASVAIEVDGVPYEALVAGNVWSISLPSAIAVGLPPSTLVTADASDSAGNIANQAESTLTVDLVPPAVAINPLQLATSVNQNSYQIGGSCTVNSGVVQVAIIDASPDTQTVSCAANGTWTATFDVTAVTEGVNTIIATASQADIAGNVGTAGPVTANKDTSIAAISIATVSGDDTINLSEAGSSLILQGTTGGVENNQVVTVNVAGIPYFSNVNNNQWLVIVPAFAVQTFGSSELITADVATLAGVDAQTATRTITVDLIPPDAPTVMTLVTNVTRPIITGTANTGNGETLEVRINGDLYTTDDGHLVDHGDGTWTLTIPAELGEGVFAVEVTLIDFAGNPIVESGAGALTIDTTAPDAPTVALDLVDADDSGASDSDNITNVTNARFAVAVGEALANTDLELLADGIVVGAGRVDADGSFVVESSGLTDGAIDIAYRYIDESGNVGPLSTALSVVIDTATDVPLIDQPVMSDDVINAAESSVTIVTGTSEPDASLILTLEDSLAGSVVSAPFSADSSGNFSSVQLDASSLEDGTIDILLEATDIAGNVASAIPVSVTLQTTGPELPVVTPLVTNNPLPTITGTAPISAGSTLEVVLDGLVYRLSDGTLVDTGSGVWSLTVDANSPLVDGVYDLSVTATDAADNSSVDTTVDELIVDTVAPTVPTITPLLANTMTPVLSGTAVVGNGERLTVEIDGVTYGALEAAPIAVDALGFWSVAIDAATPLSHGIHEVVARVSDAAGNISVDTSVFEVEVDLIAPSLTLAVIDDDDVIGVAETLLPLSLSGSTDVADGTSVTLDIAGDLFSAVAASGGWSVTLTPATLSSLADTTLISASVTDLAGNVSVPATRTLSIDRTAPNLVIDPLPAITALSAPAVDISGSCETGVPVDVSVASATPVSQSVDCVAGRFIATFDLSAIADGPDAITVTVAQLDIAGNPASGSLSSDKDTVAPSVTITSLSHGSDAVIDNSEALSFDITGEVSSDAVIGDTITLIVSDGVSNVEATTTVESADSWQVTGLDISSLNDGPISFTATVSDSAGNVSQPDVLGSTIRASLPQITIELASPVWENAVMLSGLSGVPDGLGGPVSVTDVDGNMICIPFTESGVWNCAIAGSTPDGDYEFVASVTDLFGNAGTANLSVTIDSTIDTDADTIPDSVEGTVDTDGDGLPDNVDLDSDNDGIPDAVEGSDDPDGDSLPSFRDPDSDGDGISDSDEAGTDPSNPRDTDGDSIADFIDLDSDNDDVPDSEEGTGDADGDGIIDVLDNDDNSNGNPNNQTGSEDPDSDGDGIADAIEGTGDSDDDGIADFLDTDSDNDSLPDSLEGELDSDNDGIPDFQDRDSDNDTISDALEGTEDPDGDSLPNYIDEDSDGDGINDIIEATLDSDSDGITNLLDLDSDNDRIPDAIETAVDSDGDGVYDAIDLDSDNDGLPDSFESVRSGVSPLGLNSELAGRLGLLLADDVDQDQTGLLNDDVPEITIDSDSDSVPDHLDLDSDNDSIPDTIEAGASDANLDGRIDNFIDLNQNGWNDATEQNPLEAADTDNDGLRDFRDLDSDQDGLSDLFEVAGNDADSNGLVDAFVDADNDGLDDAVAIFQAMLIDSDNDGIYDFLEIDSNNDGQNDLVEAGGNDVDGDGIVDTLKDSDSDGIPDSVDVDVTGGSDADNDGIDDLADADFVAGEDQDFDGIVDARDPDANGDGFADAGVPVLGESTPNTDVDQLPGTEQTTDTRPVRTGATGNGFGCSIGDGTGSSSDSELMLLLFAAFAAMWSSAKRRRRITEARLGRTAMLAAVVLSVSSCGTFSRVLPGDRGSQSSDGLTSQQRIEREEKQARAAQLKEEKKQRNRSMRRFYAGVGVGASILDPITEDTAFTLETGSSTAAHVHLGFDYSPRLTFELNAGSLGSATLEPTSTIDYSVVAGNALFYFGSNNDSLIRRENVHAYGRVGLGVLSTSGSGVDIEQVNGVQLLVGLGVEYGFSNGLALRGELISYDSDARAVQLGLIYRFKRSQNVNSTTDITRRVEPQRETRISKQTRKSAETQKREITRKQASTQKIESAQKPDTRKKSESVNKALQQSTETVPSTKPRIKPEVKPRTAPERKAKVVPPADSRAKKTVPKPNVDSDRDGISDDKDACLDTRRGVQVDAFGCAVTRGVVNGLVFEANTEVFKPGATRVLDRIVTEMKAAPSSRITISVHTDNSLPKNQAKQITTKQVIKIVKYLAKNGISTKRVVARSYGSTKPLADNVTDANRSRNRRVEITNLADSVNR